MRKRLLSSFMFLLCLPAYLQAATYYVNNSGSPACSDGNPGSTTAPWCTIGHALGAVASGSTILVQGSGPYNDADIVISGPSGTAGAPTTIMAAAGSSPVWRGPGSNSGRVKFLNVSYMTLDGLRVTN